MLSRRSVRVKVMQLLYALGCDESLTYKNVEKRYNDMIENANNVFLYNIYNIVNITKIALDDEAKRNAKHLPTEEDKSFSAKLATNPKIQSLRDNTKLNDIFEKKGYNASSDRDHFKKIYSEFSKEEAYLEYLSKESDDKAHEEILLELYRFCRKSELFNEIIGDKFLNWTDDKSLVIGSVKKIIKSLPLDNIEFLKEYYPDDETVNEYGNALLKKCVEGDKALLELIKPLLTNWDHERVAMIDMILLKMAACEMLEFPTIPAKVTLNEYVEVAKSYSTDKSKEFVNGVLDKLMKQLDEQGKLNKQGRGLDA